MTFWNEAVEAIVYCKEVRASSAAKTSPPYALSRTSSRCLYDLGQQPDCYEVSMLAGDEFQVTRRSRMHDCQCQCYHKMATTQNNSCATSKDCRSADIKVQQCIQGQQQIISPDQVCEGVGSIFSKLILCWWQEGHNILLNQPVCACITNAELTLQERHLRF